MHINLEAGDQHAIQSYSENQIQINSISYEQSLIVSREEIISDLTIKSVLDIDEAYLSQLLNLQPELILIGHNDSGKFPPIAAVAHLSTLGVGMETMTVGAACRTFNILLSEGRKVAAGFIFA